MSEGGQGKGEKPLPEGSTAARAQAALREGNFALARSLARTVLSDASASDRAKDEAKNVLDATRIDRAPIVVGIVMLLVLAALFTYVLTRAHS